MAPSWFKCNFNKKHAVALHSGHKSCSLFKMRDRSVKCLWCPMSRLVGNGNSSTQLVKLAVRRETSNWTLRQLRGKWRGNRDEVEIVGAVVDGHLLALAQVGRVAVALVAELVQREPAVHQHSWARKGKSCAHLLDWVIMKPHESESRLLFWRIPEFYPSTRSWKLPLPFSDG